MANVPNPEMQACIDACLECYRTCQQMASQHCLPSGGRHVEPHHMRLMLACAEICRTSAHFMLTGVDEHRHVCAACAEVCEACAQSCEEVGDMDECVAACRDCAQTCREMAGLEGGLRMSGQTGSTGQAGAVAGGQLAM